MRESLDLTLFLSYNEVFEVSVVVQISNVTDILFEPNIRRTCLMRMRQYICVA